MCQETAKILYCFVFAIVCILGITSCEKSNVETAFFEDAPGKIFMFKILALYWNLSALIVITIIIRLLHVMIRI